MSSDDDETPIDPASAEGVSARRAGRWKINFPARKKDSFVLNLAEQREALITSLDALEVKFYEHLRSIEQELNNDLTTRISELEGIETKLNNDLTTRISELEGIETKLNDDLTTQRSGVNNDIQAHITRLDTMLTNQRSGLNEDIKARIGAESLQALVAQEKDKLRDSAKNILQRKALLESIAAARRRMSNSGSNLKW